MPIEPPKRIQWFILAEKFDSCVNHKSKFNLLVISHFGWRYIHFKKCLWGMVKKAIATSNRNSGMEDEYETGDELVNYKRIVGGKWL